MFENNRSHVNMKFAIKFFAVYTKDLSTSLIGTTWDN